MAITDDFDSDLDDDEFGETGDPDDFYEDEPDDDGDDHYEEYKDGVAMGYLNEDGSQADGPSEPPDWMQERDEQRATAEHIVTVHGGALCGCPPDPDPWALPGRPSFADEPPF